MLYQSIICCELSPYCNDISLSLASTCSFSAFISLSVAILLINKPSLTLLEASSWNISAGNLPLEGIPCCSILDSMSCCNFSASELTLPSGTSKSFAARSALKAVSLFCCTRRELNSICIWLLIRVFIVSKSFSPNFFANSSSRLTSLGEPISFTLTLNTASLPAKFST